MGDNHFNYLHMTEHELRLLDDDEDAALLNEPLPDEDIEVPAGLVPPRQDEEDESILPSASHPSYPYGNPYTLSLLPLRPSARSTKKGLRGNPHTRHMHTWTDLALEDLLPWEGDDPDLNYWAGLEAEAAAAAHAAAATAAAAATGAANIEAGEAAAAAADGQAQMQPQEGQDAANVEQEQDDNSDNGSDTTDVSDT